MSRVDTAELRRLHEAATKGKWSVMIDEHETEEDGTVIAGEIAIPEINRMLHSTEWAESSDWQRDLDNAEFIAACHNALPALLDELEAAREELRRLREVVTAPTYREALALLAGKDARDRHTKALGAAEWLEANNERLDTMNRSDVEEVAAQLRREAEGK